MKRERESILTAADGLCCRYTCAALSVGHGLLLSMIAVGSGHVVEKPHYFT